MGALPQRRVSISFPVQYQESYSVRYSTRASSGKKKEPSDKACKAAVELLLWQSDTSLSSIESFSSAPNAFRVIRTSTMHIVRRRHRTPHPQCSWNSSKWLSDQQGRALQGESQYTCRRHHLLLTAMNFELALYPLSGRYAHSKSIRRSPKPPIVLYATSSRTYTHITFRRPKST